MFLGTLWSSIKQIRAAYVFDWEHGIALDAMQGNQAWSLTDWEVSLFFSSCGGNLGCILDFRWGFPFKTRVCSVTSGLLSSYDGHLGKLNYAWQENIEASGCELGGQASLIVGTVILGFLTIFQKCRASLTFESLNSTSLSRCQRDVRPMPR